VTGVIDFGWHRGDSVKKAAGDVPPNLSTGPASETYDRGDTLHVGVVKISEESLANARVLVRMAMIDPPGWQAPPAFRSGRANRWQ
jgi:hypothetical protein